MMRRFGSRLLVTGFIAALIPVASADNLYKGSSWTDLASDNKAAAIGDILTVIVYQSAEARNSSRSDSRRRNGFDLEASVGTFSDRASLDLDRSVSGSGEFRRSESLLTQFSVTVVGELPNGDLLIEGEQLVFVNDERSQIGVRGRVRRVDISPDNQIVSTQIANAEIDYDGSGYVARSAKPGLLGRLFLFFGL